MYSYHYQHYFYLQSVGANEMFKYQSIEVYLSTV